MEPVGTRHRELKLIETRKVQQSQISRNKQRQTRIAGKREEHKSHSAGIDELLQDENSMQQTSGSVND